MGLFSIWDRKAGVLRPVTSNGLLLEEIFWVGLLQLALGVPGFLATFHSGSPSLSSTFWKQVSGKRVVSSSRMNRHCLLFTQGAGEPACVLGLSCGIQEICFVCWQVCLSMSCELSLRLWLQISSTETRLISHKPGCASFSSTGDTPDSLTSFSLSDFMHTWTRDLWPTGVGWISSPFMHTEMKNYSFLHAGGGEGYSRRCAMTSPRPWNVWQNLSLVRSNIQRRKELIKTFNRWLSG